MQFLITEILSSIKTTKGKILPLAYTKVLKSPQKKKKNTQYTIGRRFIIQLSMEPTKYPETTISWKDYSLSVCWNFS